MSQVVYTVACRFTDSDVAQRWLDWLRAEHLADVLRGGATQATVVRYEPDEPGGAVRLEVHYRFPSRDAFESYEREHAPTLREEGLRRFPLELGLTYSRSVGEVVAEQRKPSD